MKKITEIKPEFVEQIPENLEDGILYISEKYKVAVHLCACGCKVKTVIPIKDGDWILFKSEGDRIVSLRPSIGNFSGESPYHAHYYITSNKIQWL